MKNIKIGSIVLALLLIFCTTTIARGYNSFPIAGNTWNAFEKLLELSPEQREQIKNIVMNNYPKDIAREIKALNLQLMESISEGQEQTVVVSLMKELDSAKNEYTNILLSIKIRGNLSLFTIH